MTFTKVVAGAVMVQGLALLGLSAANANVILTYTGNDFTTLSPPGPPSNYTATDKVTASITLANPLGDNLNLASVTPLAFSLNDGVQTITDASSLAVKEFLFSTDSAGAITAWVVEVRPSAHPGLINTTNAPFPNMIRDIAEAANQFGGTFDALVEREPGKWTTSGVAAPTPAQLSLLKTIPINGTAANRATKMYSFDISWWDPTTGLYFLADRSNAAIDVIDTTGAFVPPLLSGVSSGRPVLIRFPDTLYGQIGGPSIGFAGDTGNAATSGPNGVTVAPNVPCIFATDTLSSASGATNPSGRVVSINYSKSFTTLVGSVSTGGKFRADELAFDPEDNLLLAVNNADTPPFFTLLSVDAATCALAIIKQTVLTTANGVNATNGAEQPQWMGGSTNKFFLSIPEVDGDGSGAFPKGAVAQISNSGAIEGLYQVNYCQPAGLTVGPNGDLLVGCNSVFDTSATPTSTNHKCTAVVPSACLASTTAGTCTSFSGNGAPATCLNGLSGAQEVICNPGRGCTPSNGSIVAVPGAGGGDEVWFNPGDGNYYVTAGNNPGAPALGVIASVSNVLTQVVPTLEPVPAVTTGTATHGAGTVHSVAASSANNHIYVPLPANTNYPNCVQGCIAVFSAQ
jgi:hypothetical protein